MTISAATSAARLPRRLEPAAVEVLLCDADGNLFASEEPAFVASADVTNRCLATLGIARHYAPEELRLAATGKNFRTTIVDLADEDGLAGALTAEALERWVAEEQRAVSSYLAQTLKPDAEVIEALTRLQRRFGLAAVSSSALGRLEACFTAAGLAQLFPPARRFSAEDSLPTPTSKPDPAIYTFAARRLDVDARNAIAIEDSVAGVLSAVAAGFATIGNIAFVAAEERSERVEALRRAGVVDVVASWSELESLLGEATVST